MIYRAGMGRIIWTLLVLSCVVVIPRLPEGPVAVVPFQLQSKTRNLTTRALALAAHGSFNQF